MIPPHPDIRQDEFFFISQLPVSQLFLSSMRYGCIAKSLN
ncbi:hypothetical protein C900_01310 [Fulvivirga imtechensis AK7]|uniref:Uncharacterized protein n=1 Tax=Fulvivirga imtechensis AK7 TaxID=1237149 RepID=L8JZA8_9BACT|nr:hypothetical protein C900_01310 [Fulvivirga imtechensis AK7]